MRRATCWNIKEKSKKSSQGVLITCAELQFQFAPGLPPGELECRERAVLFSRRISRCNTPSRMEIGPSSGLSVLETSCCASRRTAPRRGPSSTPALPAASAASSRWAPTLLRNLPKPNEALALVVAVKAGADPLLQRRAADAAETFKKLADQYIAEHALRNARAGRRSQSTIEAERMLRADILPAWA